MCGLLFRGRVQVCDCIVFVLMGYKFDAGKTELMRKAIFVRGLGCCFLDPLP